MSSPRSSAPERPQRTMPPTEIHPLVVAAPASASAGVSPGTTTGAADAMAGKAPTMPQATDVEFEVEFPPHGDLGVGLGVESDGAVSVRALRQLLGPAERSCPTLEPGDVLVAIDGESVVDLTYVQILRRLHARPRSKAVESTTTLEFLHLEPFESPREAIAAWEETQSDAHRLREGEFDVLFEPQQATGLRLTEGYMMTTPLRLVHLEKGLVRAAMAGSSPTTPTHNDLEEPRRRLLGSFLVRINDDATLGAPAEDVLASLYDPVTFPKTLWLARPDRPHEDYALLTLTGREQLKWLCFLPVEVMMEVPVVSYAAVSMPRDGDVGPNVTGRRRTTRRDGIREGQYLMGIHGLPTLRVSARGFGRDNDDDDDDDDDEDANNESEGLVPMVVRTLERLIDRPRALRFRDLREYRREYLAQHPLSPWERRKRRRSSVASTASSTTTAMERLEALAAYGLRESLPDRMSLSPGGGNLLSDHSPQWSLKGISLSRRPRDPLQLLSEDDDAAVGRRSSSRPPSSDAVPVNDDPDRSSTRRPRIRKYRGLENCEGHRARPRIIPDNIRVVEIPSDPAVPAGLQLETDVLTSHTVFGGFNRHDGPALRCQRIRTGDVVVAINDTPVDGIPTDALIAWMASSGDPSLPQQPRRIRFRRKEQHKTTAAVVSGLLTAFFSMFSGHREVTAAGKRA